jgi:flagellar biosynthesis/type III secretory pathway protein FliH
MNFHIVELQHQFSNLKKELSEKVDQILNETEKELNGLIAIKLSDKFIQHYLYDDQLHDYDFEKL